MPAGHDRDPGEGREVGRRPLYVVEGQGGAALEAKKKPSPDMPTGVFQIRIE